MTKQNKDIKKNNIIYVDFKNKKVIKLHKEMKWDK